MSNVTYSVALKSSGAAYLWWLFLGTFGAHRFYMGKPATGLLWMFTLGLLWLGVIWDLFTIPSQIRRVNDKLVEQTQARYG